MPRKRTLRAAGHAVRLLLFLVAAYAAGRFLMGALRTDGWGPGALFGLLLVAGALSLVWRAGVDLRRQVQRQQR